MRFMFGGAYQGKLAYALADSGLPISAVEGGSSCSIKATQNIQILNGLHIAVKRLLDEGENPFAFVDEMLKQNPDIIIISDEIGGGIVPINADEREWREAVGRVCCTLAQRAERVDRLVCGIPQRLK